MTNQDLFSNLEDSKLIAAVMERANIEPDKYWQECEGAWILVNSIGSGFAAPDGWVQPEYYPSWRLDKVLMVCPAELFDKDKVSNYLFLMDKDIVQKVQQIMLRLTWLRGKEALHAACQLVKLLEEEKLI